MLIVGGHKDYQRHSFLPQRPQYVEASEPGHLHVEKQQVGRMFFDGRDCFIAIGTFAKHFDVRFLAQQSPDPLTRQRFVINDDGANLHDCFSWYGNSSSTVKPPSEALLNVSFPKFPYISCNRARVFGNPMPARDFGPGFAAVPLSWIVRRSKASACRATIRTRPGPVCGSMPWRMAVSTSGCRIKAGTSPSRAVASISFSMRSRSPNRT